MKNKVFSKALAFLLVLCLCAAFVPVMTFADEVDAGETTRGVSVWDGVSVDTDLRTNEGGSAYYIDSAAELAGFVQLVNGGTNYFAGKTVYLTTDIVWNEDNDGYLNWTDTEGPANKWTPIGTYSANHFQGTFDGLGHTVSGLYAPAVSVGSGFFGVIRKGAITIRNLSVVNSFFSSSGGAGAIVGAISGGNPTSVIIENVYASAQIISTRRGAGGIYGGAWSAGTVPVTISNAVFEGSVTNTGTSAYSHAGGIVGNSYSPTTITNCLNLGTVTGKKGVGGIYGGAQNDWDITNLNYLTIQNCINLGTLSGGTAQGQICGYMKDLSGNAVSVSNVTNNVYDGVLSGMLSVDSGMPNEEIKAMSTDVLSGLGFASWVSGTLNGSSMPLPVGVVNTLPDTSSPSVWNGTDVDTDLRTNEDGSAYYIDSAAELAGFVQLVNGGTNYFAGKTVYLTTDIVWNEDNDGYLNWTDTKGPANKWTPIGTYSANHFQGTFDGLGHTVSGLYAPAVSVGSGFFGVIRKGAITIRNLSVVNSFFSSSGSACAGAIVGAIAGGNPTSVIIENVYASAKIISTRRAAGGIYGGDWSAGTVPVTISNAVFEGSVTNTGTSAYSHAGGIVGNSYSPTTITNCLNLGTVTGKKGVGGIYGGAQNDWDITNLNYLTIQNCINLGTLSGGTAQGQICGYMKDLSGDAVSVSNVTGNLWGSGASNNVVMSRNAIKALTQSQLTEIGLTAWSVGAESPLPSATAMILDGTYATVTINEMLDGFTATNYVTSDVFSSVHPFFANSKVTLNSAATVDEEGALVVSVLLNDGSLVERTFTIAKLPTLTYDFASEEKGIAEGTITATFENYTEDDYEFYWGTADGLLNGYLALAARKKLTVRDNVLSGKVADRVTIPLGATHLWLAVDSIPVCSYEIPETRCPSYGVAKYTFGVLSDIHFGSSETASTFANAMDTMKKFGASFVITAGDLTNKGTQAQYDAFISAYANYVDLPLFTTVGNHDTLEWNIATELTTKTAIQNMIANVETFANESYTGKSGEFKVENSDAYGEYVYDYTVAYGDDLFVYLGIGPNEIEDGLEKTDSPVVISDRYVSEAQLNWLKGVLENSEDYQNVVLVFHYPLKQSGISLYSATEDFDELSDVLKDSPNVIHFSGHTHTSFNSAYGNILSQTQRFVKEGDSYVAAENELGYTAVHVPSNLDTSTGYIATVYESGTLLTGYDFANDQAISYATFFVANEEPQAEPTSATVDATVTLADKALKADDFEFVLMDGENILQTVKNDAEGKITFADIEYTVAGVYTYTVKQVKGNMTGVTYDETAVTVTVTVVKEDGKLAATVDTTPAFKNQYRVPFAANGVIDGDYFKVDGVPTEMGLFEHEGAYYYAQYDGKIIKSQKYYVWLLSDNCGDMTEGWYAFDAEGKVVKEGMFTDAEGTTWYYENYAPKEKGLFKYNDNYYVAQYDGKIITSKSYEYNKVGGKYYVWLVDDTATDIGKGWRYFDENGLMLQGIQDHPEKGGKYYFVNGQAKEKGLFYYEGDNNYYVAQYDGKIITNSKYYVWLVDGSAETIGKGWRYFDENGLMLQGIQDHPEKEGKYYFVNGQPKEMGLFLNEADGFYYVAQYDGKIITANNYETAGVKGKYYVWKTTGCDHLKGWQIFNADGQMIFQNNTVYSVSIKKGAADYETLTWDGCKNFQFGAGSYKAFTFDGVVNHATYVYNNTDSEKNARTLYLFEDTNNMSDFMHANLDKTKNFSFPKIGADYVRVEIDGTLYVLGVYNYDVPVAAGDMTLLGIYQFFWNKDTSEDLIAQAGDDGYKVLFVNEIANGDFAEITADYVEDLFN